MSIIREELQRQRAHPKVDEVENEGMDEDRFFVHLRAEWTWTDDPCCEHQTRSFASVREAEEWLRKETAAAGTWIKPRTERAA